MIGTLVPYCFAPACTAGRLTGLKILVCFHDGLRPSLISSALSALKMREGNSDIPITIANNKWASGGVIDESLGL